MSTLTFNLDGFNAELAENFFAKYQLQDIIIGTDEKTFLGSKEPRVCRFCKQTKPEVKFRTEAHALPRFMGNRNLLSYFECDTCNANFSRQEDSFANFIGMGRTASQIKGRNNVPKFKDIKGGVKLELGDSALLLQVLQDSQAVSYDEDSKSLTVTAERQPYTPLHIVKTLIKIGLTMLEESELPAYEIARRLAQTDSLDTRVKDNRCLAVYGFWHPGIPAYTKPVAQLWKRKEGLPELVPEKQVVLFYANYLFQIVMPFSLNDKDLQGKEINVPKFPLLANHEELQKVGEYKIFELNLTSAEIIKGDSHSITWSVGSREELNTENAAEDSKESSVEEADSSTVPFITPESNDAE